jgi:hypothetical protein
VQANGADSHTIPDNKRELIERYVERVTLTHTHIKTAMRTVADGPDAVAADPIAGAVSQPPALSVARTGPVPPPSRASSVREAPSCLTESACAWNACPERARREPRGEGGSESRMSEIVTSISDSHPMGCYHIKGVIAFWSPWPAREPRKDAVRAKAVRKSTVPLEALVRPAWVELIAQGLADAVDLIVMTTVRKSEQLRFEISEPACLFREEHATALELSGLDGHSNFGSSWN